MQNEQASAAGRQWDVNHDVSCPSVLVGLVGAGIQPSRTPALHEREGAEQGLRYIYKLIDLDELEIDKSVLPEILTGGTALRLRRPQHHASLQAGRPPSPG